MLSKTELKQIAEEILKFNPSIKTLIDSFEEVGSDEIMKVGIKVHHAYMDLYGSNDHSESHDVAKWILFFH
jgi:hypothetical protein